jgi:hypothetical protein
MSEVKNAAPGLNHTYLNGDSQKPLMKSDVVKPNYLSQLVRQIEALDANHSR